MHPDALDVLNICLKAFWQNQVRLRFYIEWQSSSFSYKRLFYTHKILIFCWKRA